SRHDVAREQLVASERLFPGGPFVGAEEDATEASLTQLDQPIDALDHGVRGADQRGALPHAVPKRILVPAWWAAERVLEVGDRLVTLARVYLAERQLVFLGHVHVDHQTPLPAIHGRAVLGGRVLCDLPLLRDGLGAAGQPGAERQHAEAPLARCD